MAITKQVLGESVVYFSDGQSTIVFTDNGELIQAAIAGGPDLEFDKSNVSISQQDDFLTISDINQSLTFRYSEGGYANAAAALAALDAMKQNVPAPPLPAGAATEATLLSVLATLQADREYETVLVQDTGAGNLVVRQVVLMNESTGVFDPPIYYTLAGVLYVPVGPLAYIDVSGILSNIYARQADGTQVATINRTTPGTTNTVAPIAGQDGVDGGRGVVTAKTQRIIINQEETYSATSTTAAGVAGSITLAALATDFFTITGSASKIIRVRKMRLWILSAANFNPQILLVKRSTANTLGTSTASPIVPSDSANAAATATVLSYSANPTLGTLVGAIGDARTYSSAIASPTYISAVDYDFTRLGAQPIVLRGTGEVLAFNFNGVTLAGALVNCEVEWTESAT